MREATGNIENQKNKTSCSCKPPIINIYDKYSLPYKKHKIKHILQDKQTNMQMLIRYEKSSIYYIGLMKKTLETHIIFCFFLKHTHYIYRFNILYKNLEFLI